MPLAATFALRALMSMLLHWEMEGGHRPANAKEKDKSGSPKDGKTADRQKICQTLVRQSFTVL